MAYNLKTNTDLVKNKAVVIEKKNSKRACVERLNVHQDGEMLNISGNIDLRSKNNREHLDLEIIGPEGTVIKRIDEFVNLETRPVNDGNPREASFNIHLPLVLPHSSIIRVSVHKNMSDAEPQLVAGT